MAGFVKAFGCSFDYVLHEISYANVILYSATLPSYDNARKDKKEAGTKENPIKADDPKNRDLVLSIIRGYKH